MKQMKKFLVALLLGTVLMSSVGCTSKQNNNATAPTSSPQSDAETTKSPIVSETLPIGSIVRVEGSDDKYMIIAHDYILAETPEMIWNYAACIYPQGNMGANPAMVFNQEDLSELLFIGAEENAINDANLINRETLGTYLPIGSVVTVEGLDTPIMIYGRSQQTGDAGTTYDYVACDYPLGAINPEESYLFDNELIQKVYFAGFVDADEEAFQQVLIQNLGE